MIQESVEKRFQNFLENERQTAVQRYRVLNEKVTKGKILFTGSSLMEQFPINEIMMTSGMTQTIYNRGIGGFTTDDMLAHMEEMVFGTQPSKIFINIGTNDIGGANYKLESLIHNYEKIILQIQKRLPETRIYMMAYYPVNDTEEVAKQGWVKKILLTRTNENILLANKAVEELAGKMGCEFINMNEGLKDEHGRLKKEFTVEGIHMYANGYRVVFENMKKYLC